MKKIFMLMLGIFTLVFSKNVMAQSIERLELEYQNNPYYYRVWDNHTDSALLTFYNLNGDVAYCIEPGVEITDRTYIELSENELPFSREILNKIKLIGYYGYEYPNHSNNNYRIATQSLIWETVKNASVSFYSGPNRTGNFIDVSNEKNEIMNLVNNHYVLPDISNNLVLSIHKENVLYDLNNVLSNFDIINTNSNLEVSKEGNNLHIKSDKIGSYSITLKKIKYDNKSSILYGGSDLKSQKIMKLRFDDNVIYKININIVGGKINLHKLDYESGDNKSIGFSRLNGAKYQIYKSDNTLVGELITDELGKAESSILEFGNYYLKEDISSYGYNLDSNIYEFTIDENNLVKDIYSYEELIKKDVTIIKTVEGDYSLLSTESGIEFEIYLDNKLYDNIITDEDGIANISLPYGKYRFHQVNTNEGYLKSEDFTIIISEDVNKVYKVIYDKRVRGSINIKKKDFDHDIYLKDALIEIYKDDLLVYSGYTDEFGSIEVNDLFVGEYKVIEKKAPKDYILDNQEYLITINNNNPDATLVIKNKHEEIIVPNTSKDNNKNLKLSGIGLLIIGMILVMFSYKKNNYII